MSALFRTGVLLAALTALFMGVGYLIGGTGGMAIAFVIAAATNLFAYWNADRMVLSAYRAQPIARQDAPWLYDIVARLAERARIPMPALYLVEGNQPNAFATGRDPQHAAVAVTRGLVETLDHDEIAGVIGHELSHVIHRDTLIMTITATIAGAIGMLANFAFFFGPRGSRQSPFGFVGVVLAAILAPIGAMLVQLAISRTREYEADRSGAELCGDPLWLASALRKIESIARGTSIPAAERHPAMAHLFIFNPLHGASLENLFATHPSTEQRVRRLEAMAGSGGGAPPRPWGGGPWDAAPRGPWGPHPRGLG